MTAPRALPLTDRFARPLRDLRVSVTDRCNFRCTYCMPREEFGPDHAFLPRAALLTFDEIERVVRAAVACGVRKVRLTGGEPLVRPGLAELVGRLARIEGLDDLALTTNGSLLAAHAPALADAGLHRVTVSLDALDPATFARMSDVRISVDRVLEGIAAAEAAGFRPVKVNTVVRRGLNVDEVVRLAAWGREHGRIVRFIEYMDVGSTNGWQGTEVVPSAELLASIAARWPLEPIPAASDGEVAERWRYRDGAGEIGVVSSVSQPFCGTCTRARISAAGELYTCLFSGSGHDLRALLRSGADDRELEATLRGIWGVRDDRYSELRGNEPSSRPRVEMSYIGG